VKIGSGCLVWVGSVEKLSKDWNPAQNESHSSRWLATGKSGFFGPKIVLVPRR
jgi:hypothetical protein